MIQLNVILVPTDLSEQSRRALRYAIDLAAQYQAGMTVMHAAHDLRLWELQYDEFGFVSRDSQGWPIDRTLAEARLDLSRFLESYGDSLKRIPTLAQRVVFGAVADSIVAVAEEIKADLIVMSPRRQRGLRRLLRGSVTDRVTRKSPCPVLSVTDPLPSREWRGRLVPRWLGWPSENVAAAKP